MLDLARLQQHVQALSHGDDAARRQAITWLKQAEPGEWAEAPAKPVQSLVKSLQEQLSADSKHPSIRQEAAIVLGNLGSRAEPAVEELIELLKDGVPDGIREAAVVALGKIGKDARPAVGQLIALVANRRPALASKAVRALSSIGCADHRVQTALTDLWLGPAPSQSFQLQVAVALCKLKIDARGLVKAMTAAVVTNPDASVRRSAAEALASCNKNDADVVPALLTAALHDKDEGVRQMAEAGLSQLRLSHDKAMQLCSAQLKDSLYAEAALRNSGPPAVPALIEALQTAESATQEKAARILGFFGEQAVGAVPALTTTLRDKELEVRLAAAKSLWNITKTPDLVVPVMIDLLGDKWTAKLEVGDERRRFVQAVIESLGRIGTPAKAAVPALNQKAKDKNRHISEAAQSALRVIAPPVASKVAL